MNYWQKSIRKLIDKLERLGYGLRKASGNHFCFCLHCIFVLGEENYANDLDCSWKLSATDTTLCIELEFLDFNVEYQSSCM